MAAALRALRAARTMLTEPVSLLELVVYSCAMLVAAKLAGVV